MEHNTPEVEVEWMGYTDGSCCEDKIRHGALPTQAAEGEIKERRGGQVRSTRQACGGRVTKRREKGEGRGNEGGSGTGNDGAR